MFAYFFSFEGRAGRATYIWQSVGSWLAVLFVIIGALMSLIEAGPAISIATGFVILIAIILFVWNSLAVTVKRLHDVGRSGWHYLLLWVPYYQIYLGLLLIFQAGDKASNRYGPNPVLAHQSEPVALLEQALRCENRGDWQGAFDLYRHVYTEQLGEAESAYALKCIERMQSRMQLAAR